MHETNNEWSIKTQQNIATVSQKMQSFILLRKKWVSHESWHQFLAHTVSTFPSSHSLLSNQTIKTIRTYWTRNITQIFLFTLTSVADAFDSTTRPNDKLLIINKGVLPVESRNVEWFGLSEAYQETSKQYKDGWTDIEVVGLGGLVCGWWWSTPVSRESCHGVVVTEVVGRGDRAEV